MVEVEAKEREEGKYWLEMQMQGANLVAFAANRIRALRRLEGEV